MIVVIVVIAVIMLIVVIVVITPLHFLKIHKTKFRLLNLL